jgi:hypothetical protein
LRLKCGAAFLAGLSVCPTDKTTLWTFRAVHNRKLLWRINFGDGYRTEERGKKLFAGWLELSCAELFPVDLEICFRARGLPGPGFMIVGALGMGQQKSAKSASWPPGAPRAGLSCAPEQDGINYINYACDENANKPRKDGYQQTVASIRLREVSDVNGY